MPSKQSLKIRFYKRSHQFYQLQCQFAGDVVFDKTLETRSFLRHDLMHFCVESVANLQNSFFARLVKFGADEIEILQTEKVVSILQGLDKDPSFVPEIYLEKIKLAFEIMEESVPAYLNLEFVQSVAKRYLDLLRRYGEIKTGDHFVEVFFEV